MKDKNKAKISYILHFTLYILMMLKLFRSHYPQGSLVSELLKFEQGKYVVKVTVHLDRMVLGTGLGAADTVEEAEDRARERALGLLNLETIPSLPEVRSRNGSPSHLSGQSPATELPVSAQEEGRNEEKTRREEEKIRRDEEIQVVSSQSGVISEDLADFSTPVTLPTPEPATAIASSEDKIPEETVIPGAIASFENTPVKETIIPSEPLPEPSSDFIPSEPTFPETAPEMQDSPTSVEPETEPVEASAPPAALKPLTENIDFSDVLSQTNIEIRRLQWTQAQGRDFLIERYGKRSRQVLSDEELLDFLAYLKSQ
ncbi:hypothetical protein [Spirulina sp. 06S082]|uniref:hypothetical protein n=1 Tax=Spirulina sp. 06S082 TaxID=3110248 RepID=UPI002B2014CF|nr:hypothetical protein [Spirulina sp. 06S082]MEA5471628.1 hypothetical protein [Spirulina sp. 06S082]